MSDEGSTERCARCGAEFAAKSSPLGLCPACLLKLGMSDPAMTPPRPATDAEDVPSDTERRGAGSEIGDSDGGGQSEVEPVPVAPVSRPVGRPFRIASRRARLVAAAAVVVAVAILLVSFLRPPPAESVRPHGEAVRFTLTPPDGTDLVDGAQVAVSPDGSQLALVARSEAGLRRIWVRRLQTLDWRELPQTDGAEFPFWSPDSRMIGFFANRRLKRIDVSNGLAHTLCDAPAARGGAWSIEGVIVFAGAEGLMRVPASGGSPQIVTRVDATRGELAHLWPQFLPDGRHVVFVADKGPAMAASTHVGNIDASEAVVVLMEGPGPVTVVENVLLFSRGRAIAAQRFDWSNGQLIGHAESIAGTDEIVASVMDGNPLSVSSTVLVYRPHRPRLHELTWVDRDRNVFRMTTNAADYESFALSPDGRRVAAAVRGVEADVSNIWLMDAFSERRVRLTMGPGHDTFPLWSPDGARIAFSSRRERNDDVHTVLADGGGKEEVLLRSPGSEHLTDWSRDGRLIIYTASSPKTGNDLWLLSTTGDTKQQPLDTSPANQSQGAFSPDGRWVAYVSDESGSDEVYVRRFPPEEGRWQISTEGGARPRWSLDGRELYFISSGRLMAVALGADPAFRHAAPQPLFPLRGAADYAVGHGRFLIQMPLEQEGNRQLHVVLNWRSEMRFTER